jgi:hypothetical protein
MNPVKYLLIAILSLGLVGCASIRQSVLDLSVEDQKNVDMVNTVADGMFDRWDTQSGLARGILWVASEHITPVEAKEVTRILNKMDALTKAQPGKWNPQDYDRGYLVGVRLASTAEGIQKAVEWVIGLIAKYSATAAAAGG